MTGKEISLNTVYFVCLALLLTIAGTALFCTTKQQGPPESIIEKAKQMTESIIDSVRITHDLVETEPELLEEEYNQKLNRYALKYYVETEFGSPLTDSPEVYLIKEGEKWKYSFQFGGLHETYFEVDQ
jgi:hypothetical protein